MRSILFKKNRIAIAVLSVFALLLLSAAGAYYLHGHELVTSMYEGTSIDVLNSFFVPDEPVLPLERYLEFADQIFFESIILVFIFFILFSSYFVFESMAGERFRFKRPEPIEWFYLIAGFFLVQWYFWLMDDAFIYFRYIDNLLFLDAGLVYNKGEYVEGFSSPIWAILLLLLRTTGASYWLMLRLLAGVSFAVFWFMAVQLNAKLSPRTSVINLPLALLVANYGVLCYFSSGLETPLVSIMAVAYALYIVNPSSRPVQLLMALSPLVRHELALPFLLCAFWAWIYYRKFPWRMLIMGALFTGAWIVFRVYYYADLFPNTYYLKDTVNIYQGMLYVYETIRTYYAHFLTFVFIAAVITLKVKRGHLDIPQRLMMIFTASSIAIYVVKVGGDFNHFRFLVFPFILTICAFSGILEHINNTFNFNKFRLAVPLTGVLVFLFVLTLYPPQLGSHPFFFNASHKRIDGIDDAVDSRQKRVFSYLRWGVQVNAEILERYNDEHSGFEYKDIIATYGCRSSYVLFDKKIIQSLGLTEAVLARADTYTPSGEFRPGHKIGLIPLAHELLAIHKSSVKAGPGMYREAVMNGEAPEWVRDNLESIEIIESKVYNSHDLMENIRLAFAFPKRIKAQDPERSCM